MEDTISRKKAIDSICRTVCDNPEICESPCDEVKILENMPSAQPETHDKRTETHACDLISRQAVIEINQSYHGQMPNEVNHRIWKEINELPSAQADSKELSFTHKVLDTVSRQQAIGAIMDADVCVTWNGVISDDDAVDIAIKSTKRSVISSIVNMPSAQPEHTNSCYTNSWCIDCKEYDTEKHSCPRFNRVIKQTLDEIYSHAEIVRCKDCKHHDGIRCFRWNSTIITKFDDFCSNAERRTDD